MTETSWKSSRVILWDHLVEWPVQSTIGSYMQTYLVSKSAYMSQVAQQAGAYPGFCRM